MSHTHISKTSNLTVLFLFQVPYCSQQLNASIQTIIRVGMHQFLQTTYSSHHPEPISHTFISFQYPSCGGQVIGPIPMYKEIHHGISSQRPGKDLLIIHQVFHQNRIMSKTKTILQHSTRTTISNGLRNTMIADHLFSNPDIQILYQMIQDFYQNLHLLKFRKLLVPLILLVIT